MEFWIFTPHGWAIWAHPVFWLNSASGYIIDVVLVEHFLFKYLFFYWPKCTSAATQVLRQKILFPFFILVLAIYLLLLARRLDGWCWQFLIFSYFSMFALFPSSATLMTSKTTSAATWIAAPKIHFSFIILVLPIKFNSYISNERIISKTHRVISSLKIPVQLPGRCNSMSFTTYDQKTN